MYAKKDRKKARLKVRRRIRSRVSGQPDRPRLAVYRSLKHIYVQAIDDLNGVTLAAASTLDPEVRGEIGHGGNVAAAKVVGTRIAERLKEKGIDTVVFDRGGYLYHGRVKALAEAAREGGLRF
ncbi:MAG: 50S ribosomal protein L18 [Acidobacteriota bacterium]|nr:MAG: 50S ribosomal protein L18 [Acidobacteriota bacterium]